LRFHAASTAPRTRTSRFGSRGLSSGGASCTALPRSWSRFPRDGRPGLPSRSAGSSPSGYRQLFWVVLRQVQRSNGR